MRIDKVLEEKGFGSRKTVKRLFQRKIVTVDDQIIEDGSYNVDSRLHRVLIDGQAITNFTHTYFMLNKPNGVVTAVKDRKWQTVIDLLEHTDVTAELYPVGRLDRDTEG